MRSPRNCRQELLRISKVSAGLYRLWMRDPNTTQLPEFAEAPRIAIGVSSVARAIFVHGRETAQPRDPETPHTPLYATSHPPVSAATSSLTAHEYISLLAHTSP